MPLVGDPNAQPVESAAPNDTPEQAFQKLLDLAFRIQLSNRGSFPEAFLADTSPLVDEGAAKQALERLAPVTRRCHISRVHHAFLSAVASRRGWS